MNTQQKQLTEHQQIANDLQGWDGYGRKGQAAYDKIFDFEKNHAEIMDVIQNQLDYSEEEIEAAYRALECYK
jgi:hypothetical protein